MQFNSLKNVACNFVYGYGQAMTVPNCESKHKEKKYDESYMSNMKSAFWLSIILARILRTETWAS